MRRDLASGWKKTGIQGELLEGKDFTSDLLNPINYSIPVLWTTEVFGCSLPAVILYFACFRAKAK